MNDTATAEASRSPADVNADLMDMARLAYLYGFPAYEMTRLRLRAFSRSQDSASTRPNTLHHTRRLTTPKTGRVTNTNADVLKSGAWIDLAGGPVLINVPEVAGRYYSLALMDVFSDNFAVLGQAATGTAAGVFLVGPLWDGAVPEGLALLRAPSHAVWALLRILADRPEDLPEVHALQDQFSVAPYAEEPGRPEPPARPDLQFDGGKPLTFFDVLNAVLTDNPPLLRDGPVLDRLRPIGVGAGLRFDRRAFTPPQLDALRQGLASARDLVRGQAGPRSGPQQPEPDPWPSDRLLAALRGPEDDARGPTPGARRVGWSRPAAHVGQFGTDYLLRARCALRGIGGLPCAEAMYFIASTDAGGAKLDGRHRYVLRFPPGQLPPVDAYWSLTAYWVDEAKRRWLTPNAIDRFSIGSHTPGLVHGADGSLEIDIRRDGPIGQDPNWLPAPDGRFVLNLRAYRPRPELLAGIYAIPDVQRLPPPGRAPADDRPAREDGTT